MNTWYLISVFIHIICAAFWIGGMLFLPLVVLPGIKQHPDRVRFLYNTGLKFRFYGWIAMLTLIVTGITNIRFRGFPISGEFFSSSRYGNLVTYKFILFAIVLAVSGVHDLVMGKKTLEQMQNGGNEKFRKMARWSGRITLLLSLVMVYIGVILSRGAY